MAESRHGRVADPADGAPPSTLAAQLVENISTSAKSSRSDDSSELRRLIAIIQRDKDLPDSQKTNAEKIEHNHMLIYVYCRVALEGIQLDDPFLDRRRVHTEFSRAINFFRYTIKETPTVLKACSHDLFSRGHEPLWVWLLPRILRFLGHAQLLDLEGSIEGFLQYLLLMVSRKTCLWDMSALLSLYLRECLTGVLDRLQNPASMPPDLKMTASLLLPPLLALNQILEETGQRDTTQRSTYAINSIDQALRQATSFSRVLSYPFSSQDPVFFNVPFLLQNGPWMMDSWLDLRYAQRKWDSIVRSSPITLIEMALNVVKPPEAHIDPMLSCPSKAYALLVLLCAEMIVCPDELVRQDDTGDESRLIYCRAIIAISEASTRSYTIGRLAASKLVQELTLLSSQHSVIGEDTDVWRCMRLLRNVIEAPIQQVLDDSIYAPEFQNTELRKCVQGLNLNRKPSSQVVSGAKRRKISNIDQRSCLMQAIYEALQVKEATDDDAVVFEQLFLKGFEDASEKDQCLAVELLSRICCVADESISVSNCVDPTTRARCTICDSNGSAVTPRSSTFKSEARTIFGKLIHLPKFLESQRPRVVAMIALRRLVLHCEDSSFLDLEGSGFGDLAVTGPGHWCLQSLNSSVRELRVAAGRTLPGFMPQKPTSALDEDLLLRNRKYYITVLKKASDQHEPRLVETRIMAWGQLGRVATEDELNLVLIKLLEYLGSSNGIVSAFAFNELLNLAESRSRTPRRLFEPFWKNLAYMATKNMVQRPQQSRAIAELLQISVNELLLLIQSHALPWLVLDNQTDVIQKIAEARHEKELWRPLMDSANLASTLALLLVQDADNMERFTQSRLNDISPHFHSLTLLDLFQAEPVLIALELLRAAADADAGRQQIIHKALHLMATTILKNNKDPKLKKSNVIGRFLQSHVLGLMARLTDVINDSVSTHPPVLEQRSCIRTLEEMIKVCKGYARIARPQMSACLLSAISQDGLREVSFSCWVAMLTNFEEEDVEILIEPTFFIVNRYWSLFSRSTGRAAKDMLQFLLDKHAPIVTAYIHKIPSLSHVDELADIESRLSALRPALASDEALQAFAERVAHDYSGVVHQALSELVPYLRENQSALYTSAVSQRPDSAVTSVLRALLDCASKYNGLQSDISRLCVECVGLIGCLDSNRIETVRERRSIVVLDNFEGVGEATDFGLFLLQEILVPSFLSATDTKLQGFLSFAMQELLIRCDIKAACAMQNTGMMGGNDVYRKWIALPEYTRDIVTPFLTSRYMVAPMAPVTVEYPIFHPGKPYGNWLRSFVVDLLRNGQNEHAETLFEPLTRVIRVKDLSTAEFLLPYLVLHVLLGPRSCKEDRERVAGELLVVLKHSPAETASYLEKEETKKFCHAIFRVLDYAMRWIQATRSKGRLAAVDKENLASIQGILDGIPAELIAQRAIDCNEYARALFHLEQHAQKLEQSKREPDDRVQLLERLQHIYANIDEPDGLEGISAHLPALDIKQQILSHKKAGRWSSAQTWYEMQLAEKPDNVDLQLELLQCFKQAGQHGALLNYVEGLRPETSNDNRIMPFAVEAAWVTSRWESLAKFTSRFQGDAVQDFDISIATLFDALHKNCSPQLFSEIVGSVREKVASGMTASATMSLQAAHELLLRCHVLTDLEIIVSSKPGDEEERRKTMALLDGRLEVIGAYFADKQYLLGIRRAAMELVRPSFTDGDISSLWIASARLARKTDSLHRSFNAILQASRLGDDAATIENAKLLWRDSHHRQAIQMLQGAIERNKYMTQTGLGSSVSTATAPAKLTAHQKLVAARAQLLLAKWLDAAGQSHATALREKYQQPPKTHSTWEKGHYYLGRHYKKILESEQPLKADDQSDGYVTGQIARLVIENFIKSLISGTKYLYQTLPRILTLWLDMGAQVDRPPEGKASLTRELHRRRVEQLNLLHAFLDKYIHRIPAYIFYTALPQIVARIAHPNASVFERLTRIIVKVVESYPRQALWSLIGIMTSKQMTERKARGTQILQALKSVSRKVDGTSYDLKQLLRAGEKLADQLLLACHSGEFSGTKSVQASLSRDLRFQHKCTPCPLVVPVERSLNATLPAVSDQVRKHKAFSRDVVTIDCFLDEVLVLSSLAKPRRLTARGSDGKCYMLLIKPKDDLRTDQRLMEFNGIINRALKHDAESSRRQLYIRTYAVVPLNEECGIIEWVPGIRTMRDILLNLYTSRRIHPDYAALKNLMEEASTSEAKVGIFTDEVVGRFPAMLPAWFMQQFPSPSAWFTARLRYTRSCAVMSMVGTILGLGDRHGENVTLEEGNGGVFHVDFNCLFDKGLTFQKPERVPFRLTHNMVAAMGVYGYEGPFRKSSELTLSMLRQQEETLMAILEAFIYDPTLDLQKEKRSSSKRAEASGVKLQPQSVVDSIRRKVRGLLPNESIPLSVEGQVEELIKQAVDPRNLTAIETTTRQSFLASAFSENILRALRTSRYRKEALIIIIMVQYRVDTVCKANKEKISKGEIRFATWVEIQEHGSWAWKHWGCVSGAQMVAVQELCDKGDGTYDFDAIDGYDELNDHPDIQDKIRRCVEQGHIDAEDFKGDPEKNRPGEKGIRLTAKQKASKEKKAADEEADEGSAQEEAAPKKKAAKRGRKKAEVDEDADQDDDDDDDKPIVKKAKTKAAKPAKAARGKPAPKKPAEEEVTDADATEEEPPKPAKKSSKPSRAKANADGEETLRKSSRRAKTVAAKPAPPADTDEEEDELAAETEEEPAAPTKAKGGKRVGKAKASAPVVEEQPAKNRRGRSRRGEQRKKEYQQSRPTMSSHTNPPDNPNAGNQQPSEQRPAAAAFIPLEANPQLMTKLIHKLGVSPALEIYDVFSLTDSELLGFVPRPALALLLVFPVSAAYESHRLAEDSLVEEYSGRGSGEPVMWFRQTIRNACGLMGLLHAVTNGPATNFIEPNSTLHKLWKSAEPLPPHERAALLEKTPELATAHREAASAGDTAAPDAEDSVDLHYVCFVKGSDGGLWELDGRRRGPIRRGGLDEGDDVLCPKALALGVHGFLEREGGDLRFSAVALAAASD
ncbi:hypothetical protein CP532_0533 [Ophiocordyceps camponoti-leonardi (nom. inval.)]|nr:hypothetical protein CP532_0533 [Ophiocordyceps camponoti-leonardi (nom. inval.)]